MELDAVMAEVETGKVSLENKQEDTFLIRTEIQGYGEQLLVQVLGTQGQGCE